MQKRQLGMNGPEVSVIGFGAWAVGGGMGKVDERTGIDTVRAAIDNGITLIDTARGYYTSEAVVGKALRDGYRERCFLATKVHADYSRQGIVTSLETSLKTLGVETVDLFQLHHYSPEYPEESIETLVELRDQGKCRYFGVSNFDAQQMRTALRVARPQSNQIVYNLLDRDIEKCEIKQCQDAGIGILGHSTLAKGLLTGKYAPGHAFAPDDERATQKPRFKGEQFARYLAVASEIEKVASDMGITLVQLAIAWVLRLPSITCALVGARTPRQIEEQVEAVGVTFGRQELARIDAILSHGAA